MTPWTIYTAHQAPPSMGFSRQHASEVMLKILQPRLQQYVKYELLNVQVGFRKARGTTEQTVQKQVLMTQITTMVWPLT